MVERIGRARAGLPDVACSVVTVANDGPFKDTLAAALAALYPARG